MTPLIANTATADRTGLVPVRPRHMEVKWRGRGWYAASNLERRLWPAGERNANICVWSTPASGQQSSTWLSASKRAIPRCLRTRSWQWCTTTTRVLTAGRSVISSRCSWSGPPSGNCRRSAPSARPTTERRIADRGRRSADSTRADRFPVPEPWTVLSTCRVARLLARPPSARPVDLGRQRDRWQPLDVHRQVFPGSRPPATHPPLEPAGSIAPQPSPS